jgi:hypothetical protein
MERFKVTVSERAEQAEGDLVAQQCIDARPAAEAQIALQCIDTGTAAPAHVSQTGEGGDVAPLSD